MKMRLIVINILMLLITNVFLKGTTINIKDKVLYVNGTPFIIKGVCYSPIPVGKNESYQWELDENIYNADFPLIKDMGANCIRTYRDMKYDGVLDAAYKYGLYVIMEYPVPWNTDYTNNTTRTQVLNGVKRMVEKWKSHPALLMWCIGHEVNFNIHITNINGTNTLLRDGTTTNRLKSWYPFLNEIAGKIHQWESPYWHPVTYGEGVSDATNFGIWKEGNQGGVNTLGNSVFYADDAHMNNLDIWGVQTYNGKGFSGGYFEEYSKLSKKPLWIAETGCDAYDAINHIENQEYQSEYIEAQWNEIYNNLTIRDRSKKCVGVTFFSWNDGWAKSSGSIYTHDTNATWKNPYYYDYQIGKNNMNEEWWGIVSIFPGTYERDLRKAYYTLQSFWKKGDKENNSVTNILFKKKSVNIPNPFNPGNEEYTDIFVYLNYSCNVSIKIFDYAGNLIKDVPNIYEYSGHIYRGRWDGTDENSNIVKSGLYLCRIDATYTINDSSQEEIQYIKIVVIR